MTDFIIVGDTETTGLKETEDSLLEVAFLVADKDLNVLAKASWLWPSSCGPERVTELYSRTHPKVQAMHNENGLWQDLYNGVADGVTDETVIQQIIATFAQIGVSRNCQTELVGRNPSFDLRFLQHHARPIYDLFSYHIIDICSFQRFIGKTNGRAAEYQYPKGKPHRAIDDCVGELEELKYYRDNYMVRI